MASLLIQAGVFWAIVVGLPLGIAAAVMLLWRFRHHVAQSMRETSRTQSVRTFARESPDIGSPPPLEQAPAKESLAIELARPEEVLAGAAATSPAVAAKRQAWRVALVYAIAVAVAVLIMANILRFISSVAPPPERVILWYFLYFAAFSSVFATPAVLAATYVIRKQVRYLVFAVLGLLLMISMWDLFMFRGGLLKLWLWYSAVPAIIALLLSMRRLRAVGPVVIVTTIAWTAISFGLMTGLVLYSIDWLGVRFIRPDLQDMNLLAAFVKYVSEETFQGFQVPPEEWFHRLHQIYQLFSHDLLGAGRVFTVERDVPENTLNMLTYAMLFIALAGGALAAWAIVSWLGSRHRRRRASDQMRTIDVMVLVFSLFLFTVSASFSFTVSASFSVGIESGSSFDRHWAAAALLAVIAFIAYELASAEGLRFLRKARTPEPPRTLLLLRVFGFDRRAQRLLDDLGQRWRYLGPIRLIAGTDLAYATVEPDEFYDFLSGRLSRAFIKDQDDLESRLSKSAPVADPDGLYRVEDFFCHDDTWKMTVSRLAREADAVFMDVRSFSPSNRGCIFEIEQLIAWVPMERIVLLVDKTTDLPLLEHTLTEAWCRLPVGSPNAPLAQPVVRALRASKNYWRTLNALMAMLCARFDRPGRSALKTVVSSHP